MSQGSGTRNITTQVYTENHHGDSHFQFGANTEGSGWGSKPQSKGVSARDDLSDISARPSPPSESIVPRITGLLTAPSASASSFEPVSSTGVHNSIRADTYPEPSRYPLQAPPHSAAKIQELSTAVLSPAPASLRSTPSDPTTHQVAQPPGTPSEQEDIGSSAAITIHEESSTPAPPPTYQVGVIRAADAQEHLEQRKEDIGVLLKKARRSVTADRWIAQAGFIHGREDLKDYFRGGLYGRENQVALISVLDAEGLGKREFAELLAGLGKEIGFYGVLRWGEQVGVIKPRSPYTPPEGWTESLFQKACGTTLKGSFAVPRAGGAEESEIMIHASNFGERQDHPSYMDTCCKIVTVNQPNGAKVIRFENLAFQGPEEFELKSACAQVVSESECHFADVRPSQRGEFDSNGQFKQTQATTTKQLQTRTVGAEASQRGGKVSASFSVAAGEDRSTGLETTRNGLKIKHHRDSASNSVKVTYTPVHHDEPQLTVQEDDLPSITLDPGSGCAELGAVTIRTLSTWRLKTQLPAKRLGMGDKFSVYLGRASKKQALDYRRNVDVIFCTEIFVPRGACGQSLSASPSMRVAF